MAGSNGLQIIPARVTEIILDNSHPDVFDENGNWSGIGTIFYKRIQTPNSNPTPTSQPTAKPLFPNVKI